VLTPTHGGTAQAPNIDPCEIRGVRNDVRPGPETQPTKIMVGFFLSDLTEIDDVTQRVTGDFFVNLSWVDERLSAYSGCSVNIDEIWNPEIAFLNSGRLFTRERGIASIEENGVVSYTRRYFGAIASHHNLSEFPFDYQKIAITLLPVELFSGDVELSVNKALIGMRSQPNISDWIIEKVEAVSILSDSFLTDEKIFQFVFTISARRHIEFYFWKIILPICLIVIMSWCVFWIDPARFGPQIALSSASMLTLTAFILATTNMVPALGYLTRLDKFIIVSLVTVFVALLQSLTTSYLVSIAKSKHAARIDSVSRFLFPVCYVFFSVAAFTR
jgi:gamma-aminobutyric acid receptor subunit beta